MRAEDEGSVEGPGSLEGPSAAAMLAVAEGLRRRDPQLSAALAEHAARLSHDDDRRGEAELSAVLARRELDRPAEVVSRGVPALRQAELGARDGDAAVLRCALADAALAWADTAVAEALIGPLAAGSGLSDQVRLVLAVARADLAAALGDTDRVDALASEVGNLSVTREEQLLARADVGRARARARATTGDLTGARGLLSVAAEQPVPDAVDGGRRRLLVVGDLVEVLVALDDPAAARAAAAPVLERADDGTTALPLARVRCLTASGVHLPARDLAEAEALARTVIEGLTGRGHDRRVAAAEEVLAAVAEARGDLPAALFAQRRAHHRERGALLAEAAARTELASAIAARTGSSATSTSAPSAGRRARPEPGDLPTTPGPGPVPTPAGHHGRRPRERDEPVHTRASIPHGLSRILDEITADARSTPIGPVDQPSVAATPAVPDEYAEELRLTLVDLLAEYGGEQADESPATRSVSTGDADAPRLTAPAPPTAWSFHDGTAGRAEPGATSGLRPSPPDVGVPRQGERVAAPDVAGARDTAEVDSGARLADLLADAMDAFRRSAPGVGTIGPVPPDRRTEYRGARR